MFQPDEFKEFTDEATNLVFHCYKNASGELEAMVAESKAAAGEVVIPNTVTCSNQAYTVRGIGCSAFYGTEVTSLKFEEASQVRILESLAFQNSSIEAFEIPEHLEHMDDGTFRQTKNLRTVTVPETQRRYKVIENCLYSHDSRTLLFVPRDFKGEFVVRESVEKIGPYAFSESNVSKVSFKGGKIWVIEKGAFWKCEKLKEFVLPKTVKNLGEEVFAECKALGSFGFEEGIEMRDIPCRCFAECPVHKLCIPKRVKTLHSKCFEKMSELEELVFEPESELEKIDSDVFWGNQGLKKIEIPEKLRILDQRNFFGCASLKDKGCFEVKNKNEMFKWDGTSLTEPDREVLHCVRRDCKSYMIPDNIKIISDFAFYECQELGRVMLYSQSSNLKQIGKYAFSRTNISAFVCPATVKSIGSFAFANCLSLKLFQFSSYGESQLSDIGRGAYAMTEINTFIIPDSVTSIGDSVFSNSQVFAVVWPQKVESIDKLTFCNCEKLQTVLARTTGRLSVHRQAFQGIYPRGGNASNSDVRSLMVVNSCDVQIDERAKKHAGFKVMKMDEQQFQNKIKEISHTKKAKGIGHRCDLSELLVRDEEWKLDTDLGEGGFGHVYLAKNNKDELAAVKLLKDGIDADKLKEEADALRCLAHPCVLDIIGFVANTDKVKGKIIMEYCENGSVNRPKGNCPMRDALRIALCLVGVAYGMRFLHNCNVIHRDLKPGNILLDSKFRPKIGDLGSARLPNRDMTVTCFADQFRTVALKEGLYVTLAYSAPEVLSGEKYTAKMDVYSFGVTMYEMLSGHSFPDAPCFEGRDFQSAICKKALIRPCLDFIDDDLEHVRRIIASCWADDPDDRPTFDDIVKEFQRCDYRFTREILRDDERKTLNAYIQKIEKYEKEHPPDEVKEYIMFQ